MRSLTERNNLLLGTVGIVVATTVVAAATQYDKLPLLSNGGHYEAYFAEAGGLLSGAIVEVSGLDVGKVSSIDLHGDRVLVKFTVQNDIAVGDRSEAAIKTKSLLGTKQLEVIPRGDVPLSEPIPVDRTTSPYQLPDALGELGTAISGLDTAELSQSLAVLAKTFQDTAPEFGATLEGVSRFSETLGTRDDALRGLLAKANSVSSVLSERSTQIVTLITETNSLLAELQADSAALEQVSANVSGLARQVDGFIAENRTQLRPMLDKVNGVLAILDNRKAEIKRSIKLLEGYSMSLGEAVSGAPFFKAYISNILPGQLIQPFVDAAFSDLGLDPSVLLPSQRTDPPVGQPGTPAMPVPYPRTGQGGEPNLTLPDAITGKPGDPRYPYREPLPAPPPGGPPPGPPAPAPAGRESIPTPSPSPVYAPAPDEHPPLPDAQSGEG
ncbi:MCE family protein [Mycobacterium deserti]|uniref:MCE family protein n=1 Tax=Mycobacterium deserti TaxID=2978347 RepID=A0ABT2MEN9_9MYCO|nr:MCE family protein [Mycobacterium deserti]MCT7660737.1 MCE family protein [Mycobacterium deserti]